MSPILRLSACLLLLPMTALAGTRSYDVGAFEALRVAAGVTVEVTVGTSRNVVAESPQDDFDDLRITVADNVLQIDQRSRSWFSSRRPSYTVRVVTPVLRSLATSAAADVTVKGPLVGNFTVEATSGSTANVSGIQGGTVLARSRSGSEIEISGSCTTLGAEAPSRADLDAQNLRCESATVESSSGSDLAVFANRSVKGRATSGADVRVRGAPPILQVEKSSGADVSVD